MNKLIIISGPTATGKTKTSIDMAKKLIQNKNIDTAIVNFDSLLFYKEISIGTAKPTILEMQGIDHHMIDIASINSPLNAADFVKLAEEKIKLLMQENKCVILVGGSAFYLRALLKGMYDSPSPSIEIKNQIELQYKHEGIESIIDFLKQNDPESIANLHANDHYRLMRAAIHFKSTGTKISSQKKVADSELPYDFNEIAHPWECLHIYLDLPKNQHFEIIKERTSKMFKEGLLQEIEKLKQNGFTLNEKPLSSIGYKEVILYNQGHFKSLNECIERIAISTRQLAKSQRTFFNKISPKSPFNPLLDQEKIFNSVEQFLL